MLLIDQFTYQKILFISSQIFSSLVCLKTLEPCSGRQENILLINNPQAAAGIGITTKNDLFTLEISFYFRLKQKFLIISI